MTRDVGGGKCFPAGWDVAAKPCDCCNSAAAALFCRGHSAFMCMLCDTKLHNAAAGGEMRHEKVWMCEVCEQAPAAVTCKADAAALCVDCDRDIHSANPLARRHERPAVIPFYDTAESVVLKSTAADFEAPYSDPIADRKLGGCFPDSWISTNSIVPTKLPPEMKSTGFIFSDSEQFLDFDSYRSFSRPYGDSLVPVQTDVWSFSPYRTQDGPRQTTESPSPPPCPSPTGLQSRSDLKWPSHGTRFCRHRHLHLAEAQIHRKQVWIRRQRWNRRSNRTDFHQKMRQCRHLGRETSSREHN